MDSSELSDVAWELAEHGRATLTIAELNVVFVRLGVGEYCEAIEILLKALVRAAGPLLPSGLLARLTRLQQVGYFDQEVVHVLSEPFRVSCRLHG